MEKELIYNRGEIKLGLERIDRLMKLLGEPQKKIPVIHIAGTNGKGSTGAFLNSLLCRSGLRVGYYQTPAIYEALEIISVNGKNISQRRFDALKNKIDGLIDEKMSDDRPSKFEIDTAIAYLYFYEKKCDVSIIETGLGGRTDATNVASEKILSIITNIGRDHMEYLGDTISEIAGHKAGIIEERVPVLTQPQTDEAMAVIAAEAKEKEAELFIAAEYPWTGYQSINAGAAINAYELVCDRLSVAKRLKDTEIQDALENTRLFGRFMRLGDKPTFIIDGAHNLPAAEMLKAAIAREYMGKSFIYIVGAFSDKEYIKTISCVIAGNAVKVYAIKAPGKRGVEAEVLAAELNKCGYNTVPSDIETAVNSACNEADDKTVIVAFGSLSWLREAKEAYDNWKQNFR